MQLYLDSYGAYLFVQNGMFSVRLKSSGERFFALRETGAILLTRGTALSADAALLAAEHDIPVLLIDADTHFPLAQIISGKPGNIAAVKRNQAVFSTSKAGLQWAAAQIAEKIARQRRLLANLADQHPAVQNDILLADRVMAAQEKNLRELDTDAWNAGIRDKTAERIRGQEGTASRLYFQQIAKCLPPWMGFSGRMQRPAFDPFNALLNYLYGILYTQVHLALLKSGIDPYMGVLHADQYGGVPTMVFDAIEPWRPWADAVALALAAGDQVQPTHFETGEFKEGLWLNSAGKGIVIDAMLAYLKESTHYRHKNMRRSVQIDLEAQQLAVFLKSIV